MRWRNLIHTLIDSLTKEQREEPIKVYDPFYGRVLDVKSLVTMEDVNPDAKGDKRVVLVLARDRK